MTVDSKIPYDKVSRESISTNSVFTKCCCCVPLRIGCFILGYVSLAYNSIQTLCLISLTSLIGVETHGFDHVDTEKPPTAEEATDIEAVNNILLSQGKLLVLICIVNLAWLAVNIACLVGLHKKKPGPIKVYVGFASARLIIAMAGFVYLVMSVQYAHTQTILSHCIDLGKVSRESISTNSVFTKCCCCVPLRIGCFILGYVSLAYNSIQTLCLISLTSLIGVETHGFDHVDTEKPPTAEEATDIEAVNNILLSQGKLLVLICIVNLAWLAVNIACLVGLHKKKPGPIKVYVGFASARLIIAMAGFVYLVMSVQYAHTQTILSHCIDLGLTAYFILVYYIYAIQLEKEKEESQAPANNLSFIYPTKLDLDKQHFVVA